MCIRARAPKILPRTSRVLPGRQGFTILEVMVGVVVLAWLVFTLLRFVQTNLMAVQVSTTLANDRDSVVGLTNLVQAELNEMPKTAQGVLLGTASKTHDLPMDQLQWICQAGPGMLTTAASGEYFVTLAIQPPASKKDAGMEIGLRRRMTESLEGDYKWLPLLRHMSAMEIRYYDPRLGSWLERWNDQGLRPSLVRIKIWRNANDIPYEAILDIPSTR